MTLDGGLEDANRKTKESFKYIIRQIMENRGEMMRPASVASNSPAISRRGSSQYATISRSPFTPGSSTAFDEGAQHSRDGYYSPRRSSQGDGLGLGLSVVQEAPLGDCGSPPSQSNTKSGSVAPANAAAEEPLSPKSTAPTYVSDSAPTYASRDHDGKSRSQRLSAAETPPMEQSPNVEPERRG